MVLKWERFCAGLTMMAIFAASQQPPHVVLIMVDDMGWNDVSYHGSDQIQTPNIDTLAYQGIILQQYYSEAMCTPARTALLTGKYPMRLGMHGFPLFNSEDRGIPLRERLLPSYLKDMGYSTHLVGKWHVGMSKAAYLPTSRGYDTHYGMRGGYVDYYTYNKIESWPDGRTMFGLDLFDDFLPQNKEQRYIVDALTERAIDVIRSHNASTPLFLHVAHNAPHAGNAGGALQPPLYSTVRNRHVANSDRRLYADIVTHLDRSIGELAQALANKNILDETLIIFASDNGAPTVGSLRNWGNNLPFRGKKMTPWEGAVRVPAFIWHSSFKPTVWTGLMHITDWLPTLAAAAGGNIDRQLDGVNQWESISQDAASNRNEVLVALEDSDVNQYVAYRAGDYKIVIGNVSGLSNDYYGSEFMVNKELPPDYHTALSSCEAAKALSSIGLYLTQEQIDGTRSTARIKQLDPQRDSRNCEPSLTRGCLYDVRRDPMERHDLWRQAKRISTLLTNRARELLSMQERRGPINLQAAADPAIFDYTWMPWLSGPNNQDNTDDNTLTYNDLIGNRNAFLELGDRSGRIGGSAVGRSCDSTSGIRQFLCILRSVF